jgi:hypothetical protein
LDQRAVDVRVDERDPLFRQCKAARVRREKLRTVEAAVEIGRDRLRFEQLDFAVAQHRHLAERMDGKDLRRAQRRFD